VKRWMRSAAVGALALAVLAGAAEARKAKRSYPGPYVAEVVKVTDSDTIQAVVEVWPGVQVPAAIRLLGVDTPEKFRPKCRREKEMALAATAFVRELVQPGDRVVLRHVQLGKYAGRVVAQVMIANASGERVNLAQVLIDRGFGRPYFSGHKTSWCKEDMQHADD